MGAYLSKPVTDKEIEVGDDEVLSYACGAMQGWRTSQEDAHNCILKYSDDLSLFAVYDGHGGSEVAQLCSSNLPDFIKSNDEFNKGNYNEALIHSLLDFDASLLTSENQESLKKLANIEDDKSDEEDNNDDDGDDPSLLQEEADKPLALILQEYHKHLLKNGSIDSFGNVDSSTTDISHDVDDALKLSSDVPVAENSTKKVFDNNQEANEEEDEDDEEYVADDDEEDEDDEEDDEADDDEDDENDEDGDEEGNDADNSDVDAAKLISPLQYFTAAPGYDSGSTVVLSLIDRKNLRVYVANAGDSRCVLCRQGKAIDLSIDHKPEDEMEAQRIRRAGGILSEDGRVNGGLNLSRSIGDHSYKRNQEFDLKDQMISALPDIQTIDIKPQEDEFLILACDGIWNSFSSQDLVDFIKKRISSLKLADLISEIFTSCLAPDTAGDGTGCDNMTCIIVRFNYPSINSVCNGESAKRKMEPDGDSDVKPVKITKTTH